MKYLVIILSLFLFTNKSFSKQIPTGHQLVRLVCQATDSEGHLEDYVLILEQSSSKPLSTEITGLKTIDGSVLIDPENEIYLTDDAAFRLRVYEASLVSKEKTEEEIIEGLLSSKAGLDLKNRPMDYTGTGARLDDDFIFKSTGPYKFLKKVKISMKNFKGYMNTNLGASRSLEDGYYTCQEPVLIPEMIEESKK